MIPFIYLRHVATLELELVPLLSPIRLLAKYDSGMGGGVVKMAINSLFFGGGLRYSDPKKSHTCTKNANASTCVNCGI